MRRIFLTFVFIASVILPTVAPISAVQAAPAPPYAVVQVPRLNVRALPSTNAPVVGQIEQDERVTILGRNGEGTWLRIESASGLGGWIFAELAQTSVPLTALDVFATATPPPTAPPAPSQSQSAVAASENRLAVYQPQSSSAQPPSPAANSGQQPAPNPDPLPVQPNHPVSNADDNTGDGATNIQLQPICLPNRLRTVPLGGRPQSVTALDDRLYVALANVNSLMVVDTGMDMMLGTSRTTAKRIGSVVAHGNALYVADRGGERLIVTTRYGAVKGSIDLPAEPGPVAALDGRAFVLHPQIGAVSIIDLSSKEIVSTLSIGAEPRQIVVIGGRALIGHAAGFLSVVDGFGRRQEQLHLPVNDIVGMAANPRTGMLYIASAADQKVLAVDTNTWTLANTWTLESQPSSLAYNEVTDHLFVLDRTSQFLTILNGAQPGQVGQVQVSKQPALDTGNSLALLQSKLYIMHPAVDYLAVWLDRTCGVPQPNTGPVVQAASYSRTDLAPRRVEARIGILWPHGGASPDQASYANITATLLREDGASPACSWEPEVTLWAAVGSEPMRQIASGQRRMVTENDVTFPVYDFNDIDVRVTRDRKLPIHFAVRVKGVETSQNVWTHSATGQFVPTVRPELDGLVNRYNGALDARLWVEETADGPAVYAILLRAGTLLALAPMTGGPTPQLRWARDNGVTEPELVVGQAETRQEDGFVFTVWRFPGVNPNDFLRDAAQVRFWVEIPDVDVNSGVLAWGQDIRTLGARLPIPVVGCNQEIASR